MGAKWKREHLWLFLMALDFDSDAHDLDVEVGPNMFDTPDNRVFRVISFFLFSKLQQSHRTPPFKYGSFAVENITDPHFWKQCCTWLKDTANESQMYLQNMTTSSFIFPTGPKFIDLLYQLARWVVVEDMERSSKGTDTPFVEAVHLKPKDMYMASARQRVAYNKLLQIFLKEGFVIQGYQKKAQLLIEEISQMNSEYAFLQVQSCKMKQNDQNKSDKTERIQKVRTMWTLIMEILTSLKKRKEVLDSVLEERVDCCILDGSNVFGVPRILACRVESDIEQAAFKQLILENKPRVSGTKSKYKLCTGNVYEAGKLNFLVVIQLLNEALRTLRDEHCQFELKNFQLIEDKITHCNNTLQRLEAKRLKRKALHPVSVSGSLYRKQEEWKAKWKSVLGLCPFDLILCQDPELRKLRALPSHSFNLAEEDDSTFCQHLVSVPDVCDSIHEVRYEKHEGALETMMDNSVPPLRCPLPPLPRPMISSMPLELSKPSENRDMLIKKERKKPVPSEILKVGKYESAISEVCENAGDHVIQTESLVKKEDPLEKARDELAEEVAKAVMSESPQSGEGEGMALENLISSLTFNPFLTRKQIPRTPENLLTEIRSSWRKAIQTEGSSDIELTTTEVMTEEAPMDARPTVQKASDSTVLCFAPATPVSDSDTLKSLLSFTAITPQDQMRVSHIIGSSVSETSGMQESERTEAQEFNCIIFSKSSVEDPEKQAFQYVKKSMNTPDICSESKSRTEVLTSDFSQSFLVDGVLHRTVSPYIDDYALFGILGETLPEELDNMDSNKSASSESDFNVIDNAYVTGGSKNKEDTQRSKLDLSPPEKKERDEFCSSVELFCLDEEFTKTPSPISLNERKYSLSSLLVSCQRLEETASMVHEVPLDLICKLKDNKQLNEKPGTKEPSSE